MHGTGVVGIVAAAPSAAAVLARPLAGRLTNRLGGRWTAAAGAALLAVSALAIVDARSLTALLACRAAAGIGEAFTHVDFATACLADVKSDAAVTAQNVSWFSVAVYAGLLTGAPLGALLAATGGYLQVWLLSAVVAGTAAAMCLAVPNRTLPARATAPARSKPSLIHRDGLLPGIAYGASIWGYTAFNTYIPLYVHQVGGHDARPEYALYGVVPVGVRKACAPVSTSRHSSP
jgi:MFS family permease